MKDIFVDNDFMTKFGNSALTAEEKEFFRWLGTTGYLVKTQKIFSEYITSNKSREFSAFLDKFTRDNRISPISSDEIRNYKHPKRFKTTCNKKDWPHLIAVFLSHRKVAISLDNKFRCDINGYNKIGTQQPIAMGEPISEIYL